MTRIIQRGDPPLSSKAFELVSLVAEEERAHLADVLSPAQRETAVAAMAARLGRVLDDVQTPLRIHGRRTEEMFRYVMSALRSARAIKREDAGEVIVESAGDITTPDFRVVLRDGTELLIEVKNCRSRPPEFLYRPKTAYLRKLEEYGRIFARPVYLAIYWSQWRMWTLHSVAGLLSKASSPVVRLPLTEALRTNEMWILGDASLATRFPLTFRISVDAEPQARDGDTITYVMTILNVEMLCAGEPIRSKRDQAIAFGLMCHGGWPEAQEVTMDGDRPSVIEYRYTPSEPDPNYDFAIVSSLSSFASAAFNELTVDARGVRRIRSRTLPRPPYPGPDEKYHGQDLPLWRFIMQPAPPDTP